MPRLKRVQAAVACLAYPVLCLTAVALDDPRWAAVGIALLGWAVMSLGLGGLASAALGLVLLGCALALAVLVPYVVLYAPPLVFNLALCALFGGTLMKGSEAMVSRFARMERGGELPSDLARYTRTLTAAWAVFFGVMAGISLALAIWASTFVWSLFTNLVNYLLVLLFFVFEYHYRRMRYPHYAHPSLREFLRRLPTYRVSSTAAYRRVAR